LRGIVGAQFIAPIAASAWDAGAMNCAPTIPRKVIYYVSNQWVSLLARDGGVTHIFRLREIVLQRLIIDGDMRTNNL
jgi:hypothetical protein